MHYAQVHFIPGMQDLVHKCTSVCMYACMHACVFGCVCVCMHALQCTCVYIYMLVCVHACVGPKLMPCFFLHHSLLQGMFSPEPQTCQFQLV